MEENRDISPQLISIIMPCYNAERFIGASIESVLRQSYRNFELIVIDDGSTDGSKEVVAAFCKKDERVRLLAQENRGAGPSRNTGLSRARGAFVAFLDADDYWDDHFLRQMYGAITSTGVDLVYCGWQNVGKLGGQGVPFIPPDYADVDKVRLFLGGCRWPIHAVLTKRRALEAVGGFNEALTSCMDYDLWLRLVGNAAIHRVKEVLAFYRHHAGEQITKNRVRVARNHYRVQSDYLSKHPAVKRRLGRKEIRSLTLGEVRKRAYTSYWQRDLEAARVMFRWLMKTGYMGLGDVKYMLPALLPIRIHQLMIKRYG